MITRRVLRRARGDAMPAPADRGDPVVPETGSPEGLRLEDGAVRAIGEGGPGRQGREFFEFLFLGS